MRRGKTDAGEAVRAARRFLGLDQSELAAKVHVARETVSRWESGEHPPPLEQRLKILALVAHEPAVATPLRAAFDLTLPDAARSGQDASAARDAATQAVRAAADVLEMTPKSVRRVLEVVRTELRAVGLTLADAVHALPDETPRRTRSPRPRAG